MDSNFDDVETSSEPRPSPIDGDADSGNGKNVGSPADGYTGSKESIEGQRGLASDYSGITGKIEVYFVC
jgi:hypothetical protein